ncbi:TPA: GntR family transcriptional regulator [Photobacterium damselae]|uniref:Transcriptional regulator GntR family n=2 Tax=Photobacterium damselae TaxID=38293 RepID=D0Z3R9_PHODD|nr:GntR family transcriptional regulator [Photobacterium damselae]AWK84208.1 GntR family transcriptional regulator [Photobacterium damselae]EEZ40050.1 transcriptional regulator GntR family [Photobacterium damselae subsp. damselae CIP 102761]EHA1080051.1 GntR family transcriptional regulator [Photobacterium damselae]ELI6449333.1 GntR family transcriptional regulator [Photobacterium damselae]KAB1181126.1 GntR family transcriptional regulator [Photobacterium damselae subsp. damselae]
MKINKQSLEEQATEFIRNMIVSGQLAMGEKIVESTLSKDLELSRSTVRMALNSLSHEGLVVQKPYVGWHVFTLSQDDLWELYNLRVAIESQAAVMAAERATEEDKKELSRIYQDFCQFCLNDSLDIIAVCEKDFEFHRKVVEISKSNKFIKIYEQISNQLKSYIKLTHHDYDLSQSGISHNGIVDAIIAGDANRAWLESKENITTFTDLNRNNTESN